MLISRAPLRISLGGGGTDLASYYEKFGGFFISAAIDKYVYITVHQSWNDKYILKYSHFESAETIEEINHPIFKAVLEKMRFKPNIELVSIADIPAGTGLGSSGSFTTALLKALHAHRRNLLLSRMNWLSKPAKLKLIFSKSQSENRINISPPTVALLISGLRKTVA
ncbi:unnamed protein product [Sphagnum jensenii]